MMTTATDVRDALRKAAEARETSNAMHAEAEKILSMLRFEGVDLATCESAIKLARICQKARDHAEALERIEKRTTKLYYADKSRTYAGMRKVFVNKSGSVRR